MKSAIAFSTLFLGLTLGPHPVEVLVSHDVSAVEMLFDGRPIAHLDAAPWKTVLDLGDELAPRRLEAVAYGEDGEEVGRATQWLNTPRPPAQGRLLLDTDPTTGRVTARLRSTSILQEVPDRVSVMFDGQPLIADDPNRIVLPEHDPEQLHYLRVDFEFSDGFNSTVEHTFGGSFTDEVETDLTAVALEFDKGTKAPETVPMGWLKANGEDLAVVDLVEGPVEIVLVRDQGAQVDINQMARMRNRRRPADLKGVGALKKDYAMTMLRPFAERLPRMDTDLNVFRPTARLTAFEGGVFWLLVNDQAGKAPPKLQRLSDALAVAGLTASTDGHRRAVVLLLGPDPADSSQYRPEVVQRYLARMRVPLYIWSTTGARETPWGPAADASSMSKIGRRTREMVKSLERQRIAWVRGVYLPPEITLAGDWPGVRLAGS